MTTRRRFIYDAARGLIVPFVAVEAARAATVIIQPPKPVVVAGGATEYIAMTAYTTGTARNDLNIPVGFRFRPTITGVQITQLGRWKISGNSGNITLQIRNSSNSVLASGVLDLSAATAGQFNYVTLGSPLSVTSGSTYYCFSVEVASGNQWYDDNGTSTYVGDFDNYASAFDSSGLGINTANKSYVPTNFKYTKP